MTAVKIYTCILANISGKQKRQIKVTTRLTHDSVHDKLVQLVFVSHMQYLTTFYCSVSFARQYIWLFKWFISVPYCLNTLCLKSNSNYRVFRTVGVKKSIFYCVQSCLDI